MSRSIDVVRLSGDEYDRLMDEREILRVQVNKLDAVRRAATSLCDDAEEYECDGLGLFAQHGAWEPLHDALEQIDNEDQVIDTTNGDTEAVLNLLIREKRKTERMRETLQQIARHFSSEWPERCQSSVLAARAVLNEYA